MHSTRDFPVASDAMDEATHLVPLLEVEDLKTYFFTRDGVVRAVDGVSFSVARGETLAIVGESGCGKSVTSLSILRLIATPPGRTVGGRVLFEGRDLLQLSEPAMRKVRGDAISMIFQEPMTSLNPVLTIGQQIAEVLTLHRGLSAEAAMRRSVEMLQLVRMPEPERRKLVETIEMEFGDFNDELAPEQIAELERRAEELRQHPERGIPWETVQAELHERLKSRKA